MKIVDFGYADWTSHSSHFSEVMGTPMYMAPEIYAHRKYNTQVDMWAVGVLTYIMLSGYPPFQSEKPLRLIEKIKSGVFHMNHESLKTVSVESKVFISKLLSINPRKRMTASEALKSPWMIEKPSEKF
jgi:serine/threonine protein kinase